VGFAFLVRNPNAYQGIELSQFAATAYDKNSKVLGVNNGTVRLLLPEQELGIADFIQLDDPKQIVERVEVEITPGPSSIMNPGKGFPAEATGQTRTGSAVRVEGVVHNPFDENISFLLISAIAFDAAGKIIGGGSTYADLVLAGGEAKTLVDVIVRDTPAKIEIYPSISELSVPGSDGTLPCH
jgi:hypothetical protein